MLATLLANAVPVVLFILVAIGLVIFGVVLAAKARKQRQMALAAWAAARGFDYTPDEVSSLERRFGNFDCFRRGDNRYGYNVMRGDHKGCDTWAFDYHYETHSTDSKGRRTTTHYNFSSVVIHSGLSLKPLLVRTEGLFDKVTQFLGFDDIDFESAEFSRKFFVRSPDKRWAYDVLHQETMELLLESPRFTIEFDGPWVLATRSTRFKPPEFDQALELAFGILKRIPTDLAEQLRLRL